MPDPAVILQSLAATVRAMTPLAIGWHVLLGFIVIRLVFGWRPAKKFGACLAALPLVSVSALAWRHGNPFNGAAFAVFAAVLLLLGLRRPAGPVERPPAWAAVAGALLVGFGWVYPHFLDGPWFRYLYAAPAGLIPCPTLSFVIGLTLLAKGFSSRAYAVCLGGLGLFYGLFGVFRLGVKIDIVLAAGAVALLALAVTLAPGTTNEGQPVGSSR
jgi:hypothetical protein